MEYFALRLIKFIIVNVLVYYSSISLFLQNRTQCVLAYSRSEEKIIIFNECFYFHPLNFGGVGRNHYVEETLFPLVNSSTLHFDKCLLAFCTETVGVSNVAETSGLSSARADKYLLSTRSLA